MLFCVEPMVAKVMLPRYGGSAAIWNASLLFFQVMLLLGYSYAHLGARFWPKYQPIVHLILIAATFLFHPMSFPTGTPSTSHPTLNVLFDLFRLCGLPFFLLSAGAPMLQKWFSSTTDSHASDPYFLYAASNIGSLLGLLIYPILIEPNIGLHAQLTDWLGGFAINGLLIALAAAMVYQVLIREAVEPAVEADNQSIKTSTRILWVALAFAPSSLLLGVTTYLTTNIAPIPLLWVIPLSLYLISFILAFSKHKIASAGVLGRFVPLICTPLALAMILESTQPLIPLAIFHLGAVFLVSWACNARLDDSRPSAKHLTEFFLLIALGGALGGAFNAIVAPLIFSTLFEYPLALAIGCALVLSTRSAGPNWKKSDSYWFFGVLVLTVFATYITKSSGLAPGPTRTLITIGLPAILCFVASDRPTRFGLCLAGLFIGASFAQTASDGTVILSERSFYGVNRVISDSKSNQIKLVHGNTVHGIEKLDPAHIDEPLTYYTKSGPIGEIFTDLNQIGWRQPVALVGMGAGSLASYGVPGEQMTFFEIDPEVIHIASKSGLFHFIPDSKATISIVQGDGRLSLAAQTDDQFGLIVLDAFTSDSIPVHLLTQDAISMYLTKLKPHGFLAFHVSNRYLSLAPVLAREATNLGLVAFYNDDSYVTDEEIQNGKRPSQWMILVRKRSDLPKSLWRNRDWLAPDMAQKGWTDDYSNVLSALHLGS